MIDDKTYGRRKFQYLSNKVISSDQNANAGWYMPRLTEEEWEENYSNN